MDYKLIDSGNGLKLEQFGSIQLIRPCAQAVWQPQKNSKVWHQATASFSRDQGNQWSKQKELPQTWTIEVEGIKFKLSTTDFGHLGIFPEQKDLWLWIKSKISQERTQLEVLNLFAYSGGSTLACAQAGAKVCHLDASKGMVSWAKENAQLNNLQNAPIRWIVEDVKKFLGRELKRGRKYDAIILDPPSFGRGASGEIFKIENDLIEILNNCKALLSDKPSFFLFSCHSPGFTPIVMKQLLMQTFGEQHQIEAGEMVLAGDKDTFFIPSGAYARWQS